MYTTDTTVPLQEEQHLFSEEELFQYQEASTGQRFLNFLIDAVVMQYGLGFLTSYLIINTFVFISPDTATSMFSEGNSWSFLLATYIIGIANYLVYYTFCEKVFKGYTLGKLITGTRAIKTDGSELTLRKAFLRTVSRIVPFEAFSAFGGHPWHDRWTNTMVIKTR